MGKQVVSQAEAYRLAEAQSIIRLHQKGQLTKLKLDKDGTVKPAIEDFEWVEENYTVL